ncbi:MAG: hypothetical protein P8J70_00535 [Glaciecola sp.]|nr:hypothetical protein [Glaciecola sp.]MDG1815630.1 hypothetical protein [Glaciecola sp.]MDG2098149.1 hypothetical protein [Glaciecola sp.]
MKQDIFNFPLSIESEHSPAKIHYQIGEFQNKKSCALVIPTNCDGEARFGLLAEVNANFSYNQQIYQAACANHSMHIGDILSVKNTEGASQGPYFIINAVVKQHWDDELTLENLSASLEALVVEVDRLGLSCVSLPVWDNKTALPFKEVNDLFEKILLKLPYVEWHIFTQKFGCL